MIKATQQQTKIHNRGLILKTIFNETQVSRADLARSTSLTRTTVSEQVAELIEEGLVEEVGQGPSIGGKPPTMLRLVDDSRSIIGVDLADREFQGAVVNLRGEVKYRCQLPVEGMSGAESLAQVYELIDRLLPHCHSSILGIGIGAPGIMDSQKGIVRRAVNLDWDSLPLRNMLEERYQLPVQLANDCQVAALAEITFGKNRNISNLIVVKIGPGVGAGFVMDGRLYYGDGSGAGEIGHMVVKENGERCPCGHYGCLETVISSRAVVNRVQEVYHLEPNKSLKKIHGRLEDLDLDRVLEAYKAGDSLVESVFVETGGMLGTALADLVSILNINRVMLAGNLKEFVRVLIKPAYEKMRTRSLDVLAADTQLEISDLGADIVIIGSAALLMQHELGLV